MSTNQSPERSYLYKLLNDMLKRLHTLRKEAFAQPGGNLLMLSKYPLLTL